MGMSRGLRRFLVGLLLKGYIVGFDGEVVDGRVRVYVRRLSDVTLYDLKSEFEGVKLEYVEVGDITLLSQEVANRGKSRPVRPGVSVGLLGWGTGTLSGVFRDTRGNLYIASNAHVFVRDPNMCPGDVRDTAIIQPGAADGGSEGDVVARYSYHVPIVTLRRPYSCCKIAGFIARVLNWASEWLGRRTRFAPVQAPVNSVDFAVAKPLVEFDTIPVGLENLREYLIAGLVFAGSPVITAIINIYNIMAYGFEPIGFKPTPIGVGDVVVKTGRTTGVTFGKVLAKNTVISVKVGDDIAIFTNVILASKMVEAGDSGSPVFYWGVG